MSSAKQPSDPTVRHYPSPQGKGKRTYQKAVRKALREGSATYKGRQMTSRELGATPDTPLIAKEKPRYKPPKFREKQQIAYLSWNAGSLTTAVWEELLSLLRTPSYEAAVVVVVVVVVVALKSRTPCRAL